ncbi:MAG: hypothetical protein ACRC23_01965 [Aeromonas jandaei]
MKRKKAVKKHLLGYIKDNIREIDEKKTFIDLEVQLRKKLPSKRVKKYIGTYRKNGINVTLKQEYDNVSYKYSSSHPVFLEIERTHAEEYMLTGDSKNAEYTPFNKRKVLMKRLHREIMKFNKTHVNKPICKLMVTGMNIEKIPGHRSIRLRAYNLSPDRIKLDENVYNIIPKVIPVKNLAEKRYDYYKYYRKH